MSKYLTIVTIMLSTLASVRPAAAQLPTATGRQLAMSNPNWMTFIPSTYQHRAGDKVDLLINFKGDPQTVWNNAKYADLNTIVVTINYDGFSETYRTPFLNTSLFQSIMDEALTKVRLQSDFSDSFQWNKVGVSSFSAGFGSLREILKQTTYRNRIDALVMADSLYASLASDGTAVDSQVADFKTFATMAANGSKSFILDHSSEPVSYASTTVCANEILAHLGLSASPVNVDGLGPLQFFRHAQLGNFELWGEIGDTDPEHWQHLYNIGQFLKDMPLAKVAHFASDFNDDGTVTAADLTTWAGAFGSGGNADADGDGDTDGADFLTWQRQLGAQPAGAAATTAAPEPQSLALLLVAGLAVSRRRFWPL
jgi:hypothetical protein